MTVGLHAVQQSEERAPRIPDDGQWRDLKFAYDVGEISDVVLPADGIGSCLARASASPLVIENEPVPISQSQELWQQVVVVGAWSPMQHEQSL